MTGRYFIVSLGLCWRPSLYRVSLYGPLTRDARHAGPADTDLRSAARLWDRQGHPGQLAGGAGDRIRVALPGAETAGGEGLDRVAVGNVGPETTGQVLPAD